jgi:predicted transcriptional regulator
MHREDMAKTAAITIRLPDQLKRRIQARAKRERRSLSAQVLHELETIVAREEEETSSGGRFLGRYAGRRVPTDADFREVRGLLWKRLKGGRAKDG